MTGVLMLVSLWCEHVEDGAFRQIVSAAGPSTGPTHEVVTSQANAVLLLHQVHDLVKTNVVAMGANNRMDGQIFWTASDHLRHPGGACASYTTVLAKALHMAGYPVRKIGLAHDGKKAVHHVLEAFSDGHWVLMDAGFGLAFHRPEGGLASASEVAPNWDLYRKQTPVGYPEEYDYHGFYYTNWDRIPGAALAFQTWPGLRAWLEQRQISLRFVFLDLWMCAGILFGVLTILLVAGFSKPLHFRMKLPGLVRQMALRVGLF